MRAEDGIRVQPLNECIGQLVWPKEVKPSSLDVMIALRVLKEASDILGLSVFVLTDDYKSFFNQMRTSPSEYCKTGAMHPPRAGQEWATFAYDTVLGFGIKMASNVAQRFADFLVHIFRRALLPAMGKIIDKYCSSNSEFQRWVDERSMLGAWQHAICWMFMYCDDPCVLSLGPDMAYKALKVWNWMSKTSRTMMAIPEKRSFGLSSKWIGIKFFTALGVGALPAQKVVRSCSQMADAMNDSLNRDQYRSLIGFLEHVRAVLFMRGDKMYGLYDPLGWDLEPIEMVPCNDLMHSQLHRMSSRILTQAGSSVADLPAFLSGAPLPKLRRQLPARRFAMFSDAAKEGTDMPGLGGWFLGYTWRLPLTQEHLSLDIPILEAIAAVANIIWVHRILGGTSCIPVDTTFEAHVDAKATADVLIRGKARSPMMQFVHSLALTFEGFKQMLPFLVAMHCFGLGNVASDAASRGYDGVLRRLAEALSVKMIPTPPPEAALYLIEACLVNVGRKKHEFCWGFDGVIVGEAKKPGPFFEPTVSSVYTASVAKPAGEEAEHASKRARRFEPMSNRLSLPNDQQPAAPRQDQALSTRVHSRVDGPLNPLSLAQMLWTDPSDHAICKGNWDQLVQCCEVALDAASDAFAQRTSEADAGHWKAWSQYCLTMGTAPNRPRIDPVTDRVSYLREVVLLVNALVYFMRTRKPRSRSDLVIKPQSAMNILLGANRVMKANFTSFIPLSSLKLPLRGLMRRFVQRFGPASLVPKRREPFTNGMIQSLASLPYDFDLGPVGRLTAGSIIRASWRAAIALSASTGFRKAELFQSNETTHFLLWCNLTWIIAGVPISDPSDEELANITEGDYLAVTPVPSKADQMNIVWGAHPLYLPFHSSPRNAAAAIRDLAILVGPQSRASSKPVFVGNDRVPLSGSSMATALYRAMNLLVGPSRAKLYTWHSGRVSLATHLLKCNVPPATIQAMLRWQTEESLRAYARLSMQDCGHMLDRAAKANIASVQSANMPLYERFDFFLALHEMAEAA